MVGLLVALTGFGILAPPDDPSPDDRAIRAAVEKALPPILKGTEGYLPQRDCFSCHHQAVPILALSTAQDRGFKVAPESMAEIADHTEADLRSALATYKRQAGQGGGVTRAGYALLALEIGGKAPDEVTEAVAGFLLKQDEPLGHWRTSSKRPPSEASDFTSTYLALRGLAVYGPAGDKDRIAARVESARKWLIATPPKDTEDRVFRLLALKAASADPKDIQEAAEALLTSRHDDGGWSQLDDKPSDAYATGSALFALHQAGGLATDDPVYRRGLAFLLSTQLPDGTWHVPTRSRPFQTYFESGFPHGKDQFISMSASSWAVTALALACPKAG